MANRSTLSTLGLGLLTLLSAQAGAQDSSVSVIRMRGLGAQFEASSLEGCVRTELYVLAMESAQRQRPVPSSEEKREVHVTYKAFDLCTRQGILFDLVASESAVLTLRRQLDFADLNFDLPAVQAQRCHLNRDMPVCEDVTLAVRLSLHWADNGLYEERRTSTRSRLGPSFLLETDRSLEHLADMQYQLSVGGQPVTFNRVAGAMQTVADARITITSPVRPPIATVH